MTDSVSERVLILTPRGRDAELTSTLLTTHAMAVAACATPDELVERIAEGAGCAIVTSEVLSPQLLQQLGAQLAAQPAWSDFPLIVLVSARTRRDAWLKLGNVTILERPIAPPTLVTAVTAALRGRRRQYDARTAIQQRDQFLAMLGHELRNPLGAITLASDPLFVERGDHALLGRQLGVVARHAHHLRRLVDDLLDVARVTSGKVQLRREAVDIDAAIRECIEALEPRARERNIGFVTSTSGAVIEGDAGRIEQVITNLMTNAIKYSPAGRTITVAAGHDGETCPHETHEPDDRRGPPALLGRVHGVQHRLRGAPLQPQLVGELLAELDVVDGDPPDDRDADQHQGEQGEERGHRDGRREGPASHC